VLVDSGNTHNFIHFRLAQEINYGVCVVNNFQIMIYNGGSMKCGGHCENVCLQFGQYNLKYHMFSIHMGGCDIIFGVEWLHTLGPISMDFKELTMQFQQEGKKYEFQGITAGSPKIISSHRMEKLIKKVILESFPNSIPFNNLRHPWYTLTFEKSFLSIPLFSKLPKVFPPPVETMSIPLLNPRMSSSQFYPLSSSILSKK